MSEDRRKNMRLQGRFSDGHKPSKERSKRLSDPRQEGSSRSKTEGRSSHGAEGFNLEFDKGADYTFQQYEEKVKPVEIYKSGEHVLSITDNGTSKVIYEPDFIPPDKADELFTILRTTTEWYDKNIIIHGQEVPQPRLVAWYGPHDYAYSGAILDAAEMPSTVLEIKTKAEEYLKKLNIDVELNSVLLNLYRDGKDSVAWHSDDELTLGVEPTIVSVSLGAVRKFQMKIKPQAQSNAKDLKSPEYFVNLGHGSLVIMAGCMQQDWKHQVPKEYHDRPPRINLTFRTVHKVERIPRQVPTKELEKKSVSISPPKPMKSHIFDSTHFPPLGTTSSKQESNSIKIDPEPAVLSNTENTSETSNSNSNQDCPNTEGDSFNKQQDIQHADKHDEGSENGNTDEFDSYPAHDEHCDFISEVSTTDNEHETNTDEYDQSHNAPDVISTEAYIHRSELNADAPDFVPKCHSFSNQSASYSSANFEKLSLVKLAEWFKNGKVSYQQYAEFSKILQRQIDRNRKLFIDRDHYELDVLLDINDGNQTQRNQSKILNRLCSMIINANRIQMKNNSSHYRSQQSRTVYRDSSRQASRGSSSYRGSSYRGRSSTYKD